MSDGDINSDRLSSADNASRSIVYDTIGTIGSLAGGQWMPSSTVIVFYYKCVVPWR